MTGVESHYCHQSPKLENNRRMRTNQWLLYFCGEIKNGLIQLRLEKISTNVHINFSLFLNFSIMFFYTAENHDKEIPLLETAAALILYLTEDIDCDVEVLDAPTDAE